MKQKIEEMLKEELKQAIKELALEYLSVTELQELAKEQASTPTIKTPSLPKRELFPEDFKPTHPYSPEVPKLWVRMSDFYKKEDNGKINS